MDKALHRNFVQGKAWYQEAAQREAVLHDYSRQNEIKRGLGDLSISSIITLLQRGQIFAARNSWVDAQFYFGRAADLGDVQGMAALAYVYGEGLKNPTMQVGWCRKAYLGAKRSRKDFEIDAVNHFCPVATFDPLMTPAEKEHNKVSIARADAKEAAIRYNAEAEDRLLRYLSKLASSPPAMTDGEKEAAAETAMRDTERQAHATSR